MPWKQVFDIEFTEFSSLMPVEQTCILFSCLENLDKETEFFEEQTSFVTRMCAYIFLWKYPAYRKAVINSKKKTIEMLNNTEAYLKEINNLWQDPRSSGMADADKVRQNKALVEQIHEQYSKVLGDSVVFWRLLTLALIGDRLQPAHLIAPYVKQHMSKEQVEKIHGSLHSLLQSLKRAKSLSIVNRNILDPFIYRMRNLCVAIEENAPQNSSFAVLYTAADLN